ncbi:cytochrome P450 family protein [Rhizoctonia solani]|uniref:Cytochrome P450 family protein n=1 Tax=Rhizoctonia solani TaxID=456999 RepID=A0A8H8P2K0_9AGAM|nr:cytochrome P450 family protein [Rhizoctonia solani]QRW22658.1 cytochrome P450 family protein [Rhizoctonia solani]
MSNIMSTTALATIFGSAVLAQIIYSRLIPKPVKNIPHNPVTNIWGDIPALVKASNGKRKPFMDCVVEIIGMHDGICQVGDMTQENNAITSSTLTSKVLLGPDPLIIISNIKETERLLIKNKTTELSKRVNQGFEFVMPEGQISMPTNEVWRKHRRIAGPSMSRRYLERMLGRIDASANNLVKFWRAKADITGSHCFEADLDIHLASMDNIVNITVGFPLGCIDSAYAALPTEFIQSDGIAHIARPRPPPLYEAINVLLTSVSGALNAPFPSFHGLLVKLMSPSWRKSDRLLRSFLTSRISEAREQEIIVGKQGNGLATDADCILDMVVQREAREGTEALGEAGIRDELMTFIFGGQDTTSTVLRWLVKYFTNDPETQQRLHDEVCRVFGKDDGEKEPIDFNLLDNPEQVPFLEAVVTETLRCAGVGSQISRELIQDEVILGRPVPKGTQLVFAMGMMSRDKSEWGPDADEWRPTRWLTHDGIFDRSAGPSFPFGLGHRSCFGQRLAVLQIKTFVAVLSRSFFFKPVPTEVGSMEAFETLIKQPKHCYVLLGRWE